MTGFRSSLKQEWCRYSGYFAVEQQTPRHAFYMGAMFILQKWRAGKLDLKAARRLAAEIDKVLSENPCLCPRCQEQLDREGKLTPVSDQMRDGIDV